MICLTSSTFSLYVIFFFFFCLDRPGGVFHYSLFFTLDALTGWLKGFDFFLQALGDKKGEVFLSWDWEKK